MMAMTRRRLACAALLAAAVCGPWTAQRPARAQQQDLSKVEIRVEKVAEGIHMLVGAGGNIGVCAGPDGVFLIDDQFAPLTEKIKTAVTGISDKPIRFVLNTHCHGDHTGGNENFGEVGVIIVAQDNVRQRMSEKQFNSLFNREIPAAPEKALPIVTFNDHVMFHLNGETIEAFHVPPAHTDGDAIVWFQKANVIHMGDCMFNGLYPIIDISAGGSIEGMIGAADRVLAICNDGTKLIPGHGPLATPADLKDFRGMLAGVRDAVKAQIAAKKTLEETQATKLTAPFDEKWGNGILKADRFVEIVYKDLSR
jgi:cyclase